MRKHTGSSVFAILIFLFLTPLIVTAEDGMVHLIGHYTAPVHLHDDDVTFLTGINSGEYLEIIVEGTIYDFVHVRLGFEGEGDDFRLVEKGSLNTLGTLTDQIVIIETYLPEGIPSERIKWKDGSGKAYEHEFYENGMGGNEWSFVIHDAPGYWPLSGLDYRTAADPVTGSLPDKGASPYRPIPEYIEQPGYAWTGRSPGGFYPVGWSRDGKFAYVEVGDGDLGGIMTAPVSLCIMDMITDQVVYEEDIRDVADIRFSYAAGDFRDPLIDVEEAWKSISGEYEKELSRLGVERMDGADFLSFPLQNGGATFKAVPIAEEGSGEDPRFLSEYGILIEKAGAGRKAIYRRRPRTISSSPVIGITVWGAFKSPFENRIAVLYGLWREGEDGPDLSLGLSGCHLGVGYE